MRDFDTVNEIMSNLDDDTYRLVQLGAESYYATGDTTLLDFASKKAGLTIKEILIMW